MNHLTNYFENKNKTYAYWEYASSTDSSKIDQFYKNTSSPTTNKIIDFLKDNISKCPKIEDKINLVENPEIIIWGVVTYVIHAV